MKYVLILAYDFPPLNSVAAERPFYWMKHFHKFGFHPIIITRAWQDNITNASAKDRIGLDAQEKVIRHEEYTLITKQQPWTFKPYLLQKLKLERFRLIQKALTLIELLGRFRFDFLDDKKFLLKEGREFLKDNKVDFIIATGEPFQLFKYANILSKEFNTPWVADYRDPWSLNHFKTLQGFFGNLIFKIDSHNEKKLVRTAIFTTTVSQFVQAKIKSLHKNTPCYIVKNGFDPAEVEQIQMTETPSQFIIHYGGTIYDASYITTLIEGIRKINDRKPNIQNLVFEFYGISYSKNPAVEKLISLAEELPHLIKIFPRVGKDKLLPAMKQASLFLDLLLDKPSNGIGTKTYTYIASKRPNIVIPTIHERISLYASDSAQIIVFNETEFADAILKYYHSFMNGNLPDNGMSDEAIYELSRDKSLEDFASFLNAEQTQK